MRGLFSSFPIYPSFLLVRYMVCLWENILKLVQTQNYYCPCGLKLFFVKTSSIKLTFVFTDLTNTTLRSTQFSSSESGSNNAWRWNVTVVHVQCCFYICYLELSFVYHFSSIKVWQNNFQKIFFWQNVHC